MKLDHLQFILRYIYRIHFAIKSHFAIYILQSSFKPRGSCINQRLSITHEIYHSMDEGYEIWGVFLDISKAFDKVWHEGLVFKLKQNGISGNLLNIFEDFLRNRKQRVALNGQTCNLENIHAGVPQGSILGPLFFLIHINVLAENLQIQTFVLMTLPYFL